MKITIFIINVFLFSLVYHSCETKALEHEKFVCEPGIHYQENNCNTCNCVSHTKGLSCSRMLCPSSNDKALTNCKVGTTWTRECNQCWCIKNLGTVCTMYSC